MKLPDQIGPDESWTSKDLNRWLRRMTKYHLLRKEYRIEKGEGDWYYYTTRLGWIVFHLLDVAVRIRDWRKKYPDTGESGDSYDQDIEREKLKK